MIVFFLLLDTHAHTNSHTHPHRQESWPGPSHTLPPHFTSSPLFWAFWILTRIDENLHATVRV